MFRPTRNVVIGAVAALSMLAAVPAAANAAVFVSNANASPGHSCANPTYTSIQTAINLSPASTTIKICAGTYTEQIKIGKSLTLLGLAGAEIKLPAAPTGPSECGTGIEDLVQICAGSVAMKNLALSAAWTACSGNKLSDLFVGGGATLTATKVTIVGPGGTCPPENAVGLMAGRKLTGQVGHAVLSHLAVSGYGKNGMTIDGPGSTATIEKSTVTGSGLNPNVAQNGIQISRGAVGTINKVTISGNECTVASCSPSEPGHLAEDAAGVLLYEAGAGPTKVEHSVLGSNDLGIEYVSGSETLPAASEAVIAFDKNIGDRYAAANLDQGKATFEHDTLTGAEVGIDVSVGGWAEYTLAYEPMASVSNSKIQGSVASLRAESVLTSPLTAGALTITTTSEITFFSRVASE